MPFLYQEGNKYGFFRAFLAVFIRSSPVRIWVPPLVSTSFPRPPLGIQNLALPQVSLDAPLGQGSGTALIGSKHLTLESNRVDPARALHLSLIHI